jgi:hypothetical protein
MKLNRSLLGGSTGAATGEGANCDWQMFVALKDDRADVTFNMCDPLTPLPNSVIVPRTSARKPCNWRPVEAQVLQTPTDRPI